MSREVKRVAENFQWPIGETWWGYIKEPPAARCQSCWGDDDKCYMCSGDGYVEYKRIQPPAGKFYQMWETVSEGSPISPPCETPEELAQWLVDNSEWHRGVTYESWLKMINVGWAPSMVGFAGDLKDGVIGIAELQS